MREADDHAGDAFVAHQHVRAAAQQPRMQAFVAAALDDRLQLVDRRRLGEILGRPAELEPGAVGQRHLLADAIEFRSWLSSLKPHRCCPNVDGKLPKRQSRAASSTYRRV